MRDTKQFYEDYWDSRRQGHYLYQDRVPMRLHAVLDLMVEAGPEPVHVLDLGCGEGTLGRLLGRKFGNRIYRVGIDLSQTALQMAVGEYEEIHQANLELDAWPELFQGRKFDYIVCVETLEHLFMPEQVLERCKRLLTSTGMLIVSFPNFAFYKNRYDLLRGHFPRSQHIYHSAEHIHYFTMHSFGSMLESCGLVVADFGGSYALPWLANRLPDTFKRVAFSAFPNLFGNQVVVKARAAT